MRLVVLAVAGDDQGVQPVQQSMAAEVVLDPDGLGRGAESPPQPDPVQLVEQLGRTRFQPQAARRRKIAEALAAGGPELQDRKFGTVMLGQSPLALGSGMSDEADI